MVYWHLHRTILEILVRYMPHSGFQELFHQPGRVVTLFSVRYESLLDDFRPTARRNAYSSPHNSGCNARVMCAKSFGQE